MWPKLEGRFPQVSFLRAIKAFSEALLSISVNSFKMSKRSVFLLPHRWAGSHLPLTQKSRRDQESTQSLSRWFFIFFVKLAFHTFFNHNFGLLHSQSCQCHCASLRLECLIKVGDEYLDMEQRYKLVTKAYLGKGKDGYDSLAKAEVSFHQSWPENDQCTIS